LYGFPAALLTSRAIPPHVELMMLRMHLPEALIRRTYARGSR
jgi:hypothetical protein